MVTTTGRMGSKPPKLTPPTLADAHSASCRIKGMPYKQSNSKFIYESAIKVFKSFETLLNNANEPISRSNLTQNPDENDVERSEGSEGVELGIVKIDQFFNLFRPKLQLKILKMNLLVIKMDIRLKSYWIRMIKMGGHS